MAWALLINVKHTLRQTSILIKHQPLICHSDCSSPQGLEMLRPKPTENTDKQTILFCREQEVESHNACGKERSTGS